MFLTTTFFTILSALLVAPSTSAGLLASRATPGSEQTVVQLFEWNWNSIAAECKDYLGPNGYAWIQVSPPTEHISGDQWWTDYQVVSYTLTSKRGSRDEFASMVSACKAAGVNVIADVIWNHMAGQDSGTGVAGNGFTHYDYPGTYSGSDFHYCGTDGNDIQDWNSQTQVQTCELENLADLDTESDYVRSRLAQYGDDLISLGVTGFRLDAAKHMNKDSISAILARMKSQPAYISQEVIGDTPIAPSSYTGLGDVVVSDYYGALLTAFTGAASGQGFTNLVALKGIETTMPVAAGQASVFVANQDTEHSAQSLTYNSGAVYTLAHVFMLAYPYGTPTVLSSYQFDNSDAGAPNGGAGACSGAAGTGGWLCQHRWTAIAGMNGFRNVVGDAALKSWHVGSNNQIAFSRGKAGFVAINNDSGTWTKTVATTLPDGKYCDVVGGTVSSGKCSGATYTVSGGQIAFSVSGQSAIALHTGAKI